jgi:hypothetical protein
MKKILAVLILVILCSACLFFGIKYYSFIFAKTVVGEVLRVERVNTAEAILTARSVPAAQLFSFSVAIRDSRGEIHTASTEDRQWAVVSSGQCAEARFFPYPPWQMEKAGTYYGARLERLFDCPKKGQ